MKADWIAAAVYQFSYSKFELLRNISSIFISGFLFFVFSSYLVFCSYVSVKLYLLVISNFVYLFMFYQKYVNIMIKSVSVIPNSNLYIKFGCLTKFVLPQKSILKFKKNIIKIRNFTDLFVIISCAATTHFWTKVTSKKQ